MRKAMLGFTLVPNLFVARPDLATPELVQDLFHVFASWHRQSLPPGRSRRRALGACCTIAPVSNHRSVCALRLWHGLPLVEQIWDALLLLLSRGKGMTYSRWAWA